MSPYFVTKCICHNRTFKELKEYAEKHHINDLKELQARKMCSCGCRMCMPYVERMLTTGQTSFKPGPQTD